MGQPGVEGLDVGGRLALEPGPRLLGDRQVRRQDLDGDLAIEARVAGAVDLAHAPGACLAEAGNRVLCMDVDEGKIFVYTGSNEGLTGTDPYWTAQCNQAGARFGYSVAGAGDIVVEKDGPLHCQGDIELKDDQSTETRLRRVPKKQLCDVSHEENGL